MATYVECGINSGRFEDIGSYLDNLGSQDHRLRSKGYGAEHSHNDMHPSRPNNIVYGPIHGITHGGLTSRRKMEGK